MFEPIDKYMRSRVDIDDLAASVKYKRDFRKKNPTYFEPDGILVFCGPQGSGKTLSAVRYVLDVLRAFPNAILCSNVKIYGLPDSVRYVRYTGLDCFDKYNNGFEGVIFLIDEIHIEFNSLESKNMPVSIITEIAQQRKQRKHIVGTSQVFGRIAKPFREQFKYVVQCKTFFGLVSFNRVSRGEDIETKIDESISCPVYRRYFFFHSPELYQIATRQPTPRKRTKAPSMQRHIHIKSSQLKPPSKGCTAEPPHDIPTEEKYRYKRYCGFDNFRKK